MGEEKKSIRRMLAIGWRKSGFFAACAADPKCRLRVYATTPAQWRRAALRHHMLVRSPRQ